MKFDVSIYFVFFAFLKASNPNDLYKDTKAWPYVFQGSKCGERAQSPIDIVTKDTIADAKPLEFTQVNENDLGVTVLNPGYTLQFTQNENYNLRGGKMNKDYKLAQIHFHWDLNGQGSEHFIDGHQFAVEMHLVFFDKAFSGASAAVASQKSDALAVIATLIEGGTAKNDHFKHLMDLIPVPSDILQDTSTFLNTKKLNLKSLLQIESTTEFYSYKGSLTTPGCDEVVVWNILKTPMQVDVNDLNKLKNVSIGDVLKDTSIYQNWRHIQPLNGRIIHTLAGVQGIGSTKQEI